MPGEEPAGALAQPALQRSRTAEHLRAARMLCECEEGAGRQGRNKAGMQHRYTSTSHQQPSTQTIAYSESATTARSPVAADGMLLHHNLQRKGARGWLERARSATHMCGSLGTERQRGTQARVPSHLADGGALAVGIKLQLA